MGGLGGGQPFRVLIAEDNLDVAQLHEEVVRMVIPHNTSFAWVTSEDGAVAFDTRSCELILMDGALKPGSGISAIRRIRAAGIETPVVFGSGKLELVEAAQGEPRVIALLKPAKVSELQAAIRQAIAMRDARSAGRE